MKLAVVGGRDFNDYNLLEFVLDEYYDQYPGKFIIVSGGARGADKFAEFYAISNNLPTLIFEADWDKHGKAAGYIRNVDIVSMCDEVVAFWDGKSKGTLHTINTARKKGKTVVVIRYDQISMEDS